MLVLGVDSATQVAGAAIVDDHQLIAETFYNTRKNHSQRLLPMIANLIAEAGLELSDLEGIAVSIGPGSFTGLRIGLSTVKGLAHVTQKPVAGVPTLDSLAWNGWELPGIICPVINARRREVYTSLYRWQEGELCRLAPYQAMDPACLVKSLECYEEPVYFLGDGVKTYWEIWKQMGSRARLLPPASALPRAAQVASLGKDYIVKGKTGDLAQLRPLYIHPSPPEMKTWQSCKFLL